MFISDRSREIVEYLLNANQPLSISDLANQLQVTERTIYRQMPEVTQIIESFDLSIDNTSGKGMMILGTLYNMKRLGIELEDRPTRQTYSSRERVDFMILILLTEENYIKTQALAVDLNTSSQTIRNDYTQLKEKISTYNIVFETKKSEGVRLSGKEIPKRHLFVNILMQNISPDTFFEWVKHGEHRPNEFITLLKDYGYEETLKVLYPHMRAVIKHRHLNITDKELQEFLLLLAIFIFRHSDMENKADILKLNISIPDMNHELQQDIIDVLNENFNIIPYENEEDYFKWIINLYAGRTHLALNHPASALQRLESVSQLIGKVEAKYHFPFSDDENLAENLMLHISMAMERMENGIDVSNPMLDEVYQLNPKLYEIVKKSFLEVYKLTAISEDEIGYIVIYFVASIETLSKKSISVLVVCSTGIGSSKMLRSRIEREFTEVDVKKIISYHKFPDENLDDYDFIISTVPLNLKADKYLCVSPLLGQEEKEKLKKRIQTLHKKGDYYE